MSLVLPRSRATFMPGWVRNDLWRRARVVPSLDLQFADRKSLVDAVSGQNLITFTRSSNGTYFNSAGVLQTATTNLLLRSEEFGTTWTTIRASVSGDAVVAPNGALVADKLVEDTTAASTHAITQTGINYVSGLRYAFSCYVKEAGRQSVRLSFPSAAFTTNIFGHFNLSNGTVVSSSSDVTASIQAVGNGWYRCSATATATASGSAGVTVFIGETSSSTSTSFSGDGTSGLFLWGAQLEQSSTVGEYIPTGATINSAPRFDHNPTTGESLGLLVEEQRTNLLLRSEEFGTTWSATRASVSVDSATSPNGISSADFVAVDSQTGWHYISQNASVIAGSVYTFSVYAKAAQQSNVQLFFSTSQFGGGANSVNGAVFNLSSGLITFTGSGLGSASIARVGDGWFRCSISKAASVSASSLFTVTLNNQDSFSTAGYAGDGTSGIYLWGAQLEAGAFPTSYIPTTSSAATRNADVADIINTAIANGIRTLYAEFRSPASGTRGVVSLNDNTANERAAINTSGTGPRLVIVDSGVTQADIDAGTIAANARSRMAVRIAADNFAASFNGGAVVTDTSGTIPTVDRLFIGRTQAGEYLNAPIARLVGWREELPNSALQALTQ